MALLFLDEDRCRVGMEGPQVGGGIVVLSLSVEARHDPRKEGLVHMEIDRLGRW
jgi:hypothetical protein